MRELHFEAFAIEFAPLTAERPKHGAPTVGN